MVVADNAVSNGVFCGAVCAISAGERLTSPMLARPIVHLFIFMFLLICFVKVESFFFVFMRLHGVTNCLPTRIKECIEADNGQDARL